MPCSRSQPVPLLMSGAPLTSNEWSSKESEGCRRRQNYGSRGSGPGVRVPRHDDEARAFTTSLVHSARAPQERVARSHVLTETLQERGRSVTFLDDIVVKMDLSKT